MELVTPLLEEHLEIFKKDIKEILYHGKIDKKTLTDIVTNHLSLLK